MWNNNKLPDQERTNSKLYTEKWADIRKTNECIPPFLVALVEGQQLLVVLCLTT